MSDSKKRKVFLKFKADSSSWVLGSGPYRRERRYRVSHRWWRHWAGRWMLEELGKKNRILCLVWKRILNHGIFWNCQRVRLSFLAI